MESARLQRMRSREDSISSKKRTSGSRSPGTTVSNSFHHLKYWKLVVYSQKCVPREGPRSEPTPPWLVGKWMVVEYVWSEDPNWRRDVDAGSLVSPENEVW